MKMQMNVWEVRQRVKERRDTAARMVEIQEETRARAARQARENGHSDFSSFALTVAEVGLDNAKRTLREFDMLIDMLSRTTSETVELTHEEYEKFC